MFFLIGKRVFTTGFANRGPLLKVPLNDLQSKRVNVIKYLYGIAGIRFNTFLKLRIEYLVAIW